MRLAHPTVLIHKESRPHNPPLLMALPLLLHLLTPSGAPRNTHLTLLALSPSTVLSQRQLIASKKESNVNGHRYLLKNVDTPNIVLQLTLVTLRDSGTGENPGTDQKKHWVIFSTGRAPDKESCVPKPDFLLGKIHRSMSESAPGFSEDNAPDLLQ